MKKVSSILFNNHSYIETFFETIKINFLSDNFPISRGKTGCNGGGRGHRGPDTTAYVPLPSRTVQRGAPSGRNPERGCQLHGAAPRACHGTFLSCSGGRRGIGAGQKKKPTREKNRGAGDNDSEQNRDRRYHLSGQSKIFVQTAAVQSKRSILEPDHLAVEEESQKAERQPNGNRKSSSETVGPYYLLIGRGGKI